MHPCGKVACSIDACNRRRARARIELHVPLEVEVEAECADQLHLALRGMCQDDVARNDAALGETNGFELVVPRNETRHEVGLDPYTCLLELGAGILRDLESVCHEDDKVTRPPPRVKCERHEHLHVLLAKKVAPPSVLGLPTVAIGALKDRVPPEFPKALDGEHLVNHPCAQKNAT